MREIKFRAWDKEDKKMEYFRENWIDTSSCYQMPVMQYTGLKDKNGKEIYEGDICKQIFKGADRIVTIGVVSIESTRGAVVGITPIWPHNIRVIGNIYENPELPKPQPSK